MSMPGDIAQALTKFQHEPPKRAQHAPATPIYSAPNQLMPLEDDSDPLPPAGLTRLQEIIGTLLHYARTVDSTLLVALGTLASAQAQELEATAQAVARLLDYCATHTEAVIRFHASEMCFHVHSDAY
jgi:hypothetical protein